MPSRLKLCVMCGTLLQEEGGILCERCDMENKEKSKKETEQKEGRRRAGLGTGDVERTAGTTPPASESESREAGRTPPRGDEAPLIGGKTILLIDDEPNILKLLGKRLEANGYDVITAADGLEGYKKIKELKPDLVISDILMPHLTGYELLGRMKKEKDGTQDIPVIIITAKGKMREFFSDWQIHAFLTKPVIPAELLGKVRELLEHVQKGKSK